MNHNFSTATFGQGVIVALVLFASVSRALPVPSVEAYLAAIDKVKSYDVNMEVGFLVFPDATDPKRPQTNGIIDVTITNRDVFAIGLGRRNESLDGAKDRLIGVIDWETAQSMWVRNPRTKPFRRSQFGGTYYEYFNPEVGLNGKDYGLFIGDVLRDSKTSVEDLGSQSSGQVGFQLRHPALAGPIRVWLAPDHGYMPKSIEWFSQNEGKQRVLTRMEIFEYIHANNETWMPARGEFRSFFPKGENAGRAYLGFAMTVLTNQSSWNTIKSADLFSSAGMPMVNLEDNGWKFHYPPEHLAAAQESQRIRESARRSIGHQKYWYFIILTLPLILIVGVFVFKARKDHSLQNNQLA